MCAFCLWPLFESCSVLPTVTFTYLPSLLVLFFPIPTLFSLELTRVLRHTTLCFSHSREGGYWRPYWNEPPSTELSATRGHLCDWGHSYRSPGADWQGQSGMALLRMRFSLHCLPCVLISSISGMERGEDLGAFWTDSGPCHVTHVRLLIRRTNDSQADWRISQPYCTMARMTHRLTDSLVEDLPEEDSHPYSRPRQHNQYHNKRDRNMNLYVVQKSKGSEETVPTPRNSWAASAYRSSWIGILEQSKSRQTWWPTLLCLYQGPYVTDGPEEFKTN